MGGKTISFSEIWAMMEECAAGYEAEDGDEYWRVKWGGKTHPSLPVGPHGKKSGRTRIDTGQARTMARMLGIPEECWRKHLT